MPGVCPKLSSRRTWRCGCRSGTGLLIVTEARWPTLSVRWAPRRQKAGLVFVLLRSPGQAVIQENVPAALAGEVLAEVVDAE